jgi:hypothetical protein
VSGVKSVKSGAEHNANGNCIQIKVLICKAHPSNTKAIQRALSRQETHYKFMKDFKIKKIIVFLCGCRQLHRIQFLVVLPRMTSANEQTSNSDIKPF